MVKMSSMVCQDLFYKLTKSALVAVGLLVAMLYLPVTTYAANENEPKGFYTIVDGQGRLIVIRTDRQSDTKKTKPKKQPVLRQSPVVVQQTVTESGKQASKKNDDIIKSSDNHASKRHELLNVDKKIATTTLPQSAITTTIVTQTELEGSNNPLLSPETSTGEKNRTTLPYEPAENIVERADDQIVPASTIVSTHHEPVSSKKNQPEESKREVVEFADDDYVDSDALMKKGFNTDDRERFYALPNATGSVDYIERKSGVNLKNMLPKRSGNRLFSISSNYQTLDRQAIQPLLPSVCTKSEALKDLDVLGVRKPLNLWPRKGKSNDFQANIVQLNQSVRELSLVSYAHSASKPTYYWPLAIFLDRKGCVIEAAGQFYQSDIPATWLQQSGIKGNLVVPDAAEYLMLTPLAQSPDLPQKSLTQDGQIRLSVYGNLP